MSRRPKWWLSLLAFIWPITWISGRAYSIPIIGRILTFLTLPLFSKKNLNLTYIPINEEIMGTGGTFLPREIVAELISRSSHRAIINRCTCRDDRKCKNHPIEYGCTLLGDSAREIDPRIARHVSVDEAIDHLDRTLEDGLIPLVGRVMVDSLLYGVKDKGRLLTICHCCRCCCTILASGKYLPEEIAVGLVRLEGLKVKIDEGKCTLCGTCVDECFMGALSIEDGRIIIDNCSCKGCGRCAAVCPEGAIRVEVSDIDSAIDGIMGRIKGLVDFE
jgi:ferredoxin